MIRVAAGLLLAVSMASAQAAADEHKMAKSGPQRVALVELFTSEGCSSCPPADAWLSTVPGQGLGLDKLVPLALHVDYWNDIGWPDPFSHARYTARQEQVARRSGSGLYTPELVLNGRELRDRGSLVERVRALAAQPSPAMLTIVADTAGDRVRARVTLDGQVAKPRLFLALYENDLAVAVPRGENGGRTLHHDFVVREWSGGVDGRELARELTLKPDWKRGKLGLAAFVEDANTGEVIQAVALPL
jgi:hypothetical protein